ncbi:MAG: hypothetical protein PHE55_21415 [Methylococcaceae bacterium]|nr:hypothetical protein [Methylococcaceae bacterium]
MTKTLDLMDIQGNITRAYGRFGLGFARYLFLRIHDGIKGMSFVGAVTEKVTTAARWIGVEDGPNAIEKPKVATNIAFTYQGMKALQVPRASLIGFPMEFVMGMKNRQDILGDEGASAPEHWDPLWQDVPVHILITIDGVAPDFIEERYEWLLGLIRQSEGGIELLTGHRGANGADDLPYQDAHILFDENGNPTPKEHFGYTDGISDPVFEGVPDVPGRVLGRGKPTREGGWAPLATGEFILGHVDEAMEYPPAPNPVLFSRNGSFMIYRKLHENVGTFNAYLDEQSEHFPGSKELLAAKFVGRWRDNGAPLIHAPDEESKKAWDARYATASPEEKDKMLSDFDYTNDPNGSRCPFSSHLRRINPRSALEFTKGAFETPGALSDRRRILRRGLPYGQTSNPARDDGEHGIIIMMVNADIGRQFEFVQQQWINYGNDFKAGSDKEILLGNHDKENPGKAVIQVDPDSDRAPFFLKNLPRFVETRGGDYFFIPSLTALRMIAKGIVDPT